MKRAKRIMDRNSGSRCAQISKTPADLSVFDIRILNLFRISCEPQVLLAQSVERCDFRRGTG